MKKLLMLATLFCMASAIAEDVVLKKWDLNQANQRFVYTEKTVSAKRSVTEGVLRLEVLQTPAGMGSNGLQFWCNHSSFKADTKYRVDLTIKSSTDVKIGGAIMLTSKPWTRVAWKEVALKADEAAKLSLEFTMKADTAATHRTPGLFLGRAPIGTVYEISNIQLVEVR